MKATAQTTEKQCIVYYRVSRNKQSDQRQHTDIVEYCQKNGYTIVREAFTEKKSGTLRNRPAMTAAIEYAKANNIRYLICSELSRLGRTNEVNDIVEDLTNQSICVITLKESIQTMMFNERGEWVRNDEAIFLVGILTAINKKESDTIGYRIASGKRNSVYNKGAFTGGKYVPYGYESKYIDENNKGILTVSDKEAEIIKLIFQKYCDGWGAVRIANWLNLNKYATRTIESKWSRGTINNILYNTLYIGQRKYKGDTIHNEELRIIDDITFNTVQQRRSQWKNANNEFKITRKYDYLFDQRIIKCANCGKHYFGIVDSKRNRNYYKCTSGKYAKGCGNTSVNKEWLELKVQEYLVENASELIFDNINTKEAVEKYEVDYKIAKAEQEKYIASKDRYTDAYAMGSISKAKYIERIDNANEKIAQLQEQLTSIQEKIKENEIYDIPFYMGEMTLNKKTGEYEHTKLEIDKQALHKVIKQITIHPKNTTNNNSQMIEVLMNNGNSFSLDYKA